MSTSRGSSTPAAEHLREVNARVRENMARWHTGEWLSPRLAELAHELPDAPWRSVQEAARGEHQPAPPAAVRAGARVLEAVMLHAARLDEVCSQWSGARAELEDRELAPEDAFNAAMVDGLPASAGNFWKAACKPYEKLVRGEHGALSQLMAPAVEDEAPVDGAAAFLSGTADLWADAMEFAVRKASLPRGLPAALAHARIVRARHLDDVLSTAAIRHHARQLVAHLVDEEQGRLRRTVVRALPGFTGFGTLAEDRHPRVAWVERRGVASMLELAHHAVEAVAWSVHPVASSRRRVEAAAGASLFSSLATPVLRHGLQLLREDTARVQRHGALVMLRQARMAAVLAVTRPARADHALDALAEALQAAPDVVEAGGLVSPVPSAGPFIGLPGLAHGWRWNRLVEAGIIAVGARERWDEDHAGRPVYQDALAEALRTTHDEAATLPVSLGFTKGDAGALRAWFESMLG